jgi:hypothetical protein
MINEFKDRDGNRWAIDLPIGTVLRVKAESEGRLNLLDPQHENLADRLAAHDFETLYELLWLILRPSAEAKEIDAEKFGQLLASDCIIEARQVLWRVWKDFFQSLQRPDLAIVLEKLETYNAKALELVQQKIAGANLNGIVERVEAMMRTTLNDSFGSLEASLESILGDSPSGNSGT